MLLYNSMIYINIRYKYCNISNISNIERYNRPDPRMLCMRGEGQTML